MGTASDTTDAGATGRTTRVFVVAFLLILAARWTVVDSPPYFDFAPGIWREAEFLARSNFNYWDLRWEQEHGRWGGPRSYMTSVVPTGLALALKMFPNTALPRILYHLATFSAAAIVVVVGIELVRRRLGSVGATAWAVAMSTTPVYCVQIDMTGMEVFTAAAAMMSVVSLDKGRLERSAVWSFVAFLVKPTGAIVTAALLILLTLRWILGRLSAVAHREPLQQLRWPLCLLALEISLIGWGGSLGVQVRQGLSPIVSAIWCPDLLVLLLLTLCVFFWDVARMRAELSNERVFVFLRTWFHRRLVEIFAAGIILGVSIGLLRVGFIPRYLAIVVPLVYVILGRLWGEGIRARVAATWIFATVAVVNLMNWNGDFYPALGPSLERIASVPAGSLEREGSMLERSHEYLVNHRANIAACKILEKHADSPIIAAQPISLFLAYPEMGYVTRPIYAYSLTPFHLTKPESKTAEDLLRDLPTDPICVFERNYFALAMSDWEVPRPEATDTVLFGSDHGLSPLIYQKRWPLRPPSRGELQAWYEIGRHGPVRTAGHLFYLIDRRQWSDLEITLRAMRDWPPPGSPRFLLANSMAREGRVEEATDEWFAAFEADPGVVQRIVQTGYGNREHATAGSSGILGLDAAPWEQRGKERLSELDLVGACDAYAAAAACRLPKVRERFAQWIREVTISGPDR